MAFVRPLWPVVCVWHYPAIMFAYCLLIKRICLPELTMYCTFKVIPRTNLRKWISRMFHAAVTAQRMFSKEHCISGEFHDELSHFNLKYHEAIYLEYPWTSTFVSILLKKWAVFAAQCIPSWKCQRYLWHFIVPHMALSLSLNDSLRCITTPSFPSCHQEWWPWLLISLKK